MARIGIDGSCWANRRGYGRYMRELLTALWRIDNHNEYFIVADEETAGEPDFPAQIPARIVRLHERPTQAAGAGRNRRPADMMRLGAAARREPCDIFFFSSVYTYYPYFGPGRVLVAFHDAIPEHHPAEVFPDPRSRLFWQAKTWLARREASRIMTVSEHARRELAAVFSLPEQSIAVVSEAAGDVFLRAFDLPPDPTVSVPYGLKGGQRYLIYLGGFGPHKNLRRLLDVYTELHRQLLDETPALLLIGDFEKDAFLSIAPELRERTGADGIGGLIHFPGFVPDEALATLLRGALALLLPSLREGFGLPAVEAAATGTPVIATIHSPLPEVLAGGGLFIDPLDSTALLNSMVLFVRDEQSRRRMGMEARARAALLSWENSARDLMALFAEMAP